MKSKFQEVSSINISSLINENTARIMMSGILNFSARERFKEVTDLLLENHKVTEIIIEMGQVSDIGTEGMGMLYLLQEKSKKKEKVLRLVHPVGKVKDWLVIANANNIFNLDQGH
jgi:anti-anti-sigma factor